MNLKEELDVDFFMFMNNDIAIEYEFDYEKIRNHFMTLDKKEGLYFSKFHSILYYKHNWNKYLSKNKDLVLSKINNEKMAFKHYVEYGIKEKRGIYAIEEKNLKDINNELKDLELDVKKKTPGLDFIKYFYEHMKDKPKNDIIKFVNKNSNNKNFVYSLYHQDLYNNYNWDEYLTHNEDLRSANILTKKDAISHYIGFGEAEGRVLKKNISDQDKNNEDTDVTHNEENTDNTEDTEDTEDTSIASDDKDKNSEELVNDGSNKTINAIYENKSTPILNNTRELNNDELFHLLKENILSYSKECDEIIHEFKLIEYIHYFYTFDEKYYYLLNKDKYTLINNKNACIEHFITVGMKEFLPFSREHYLLYINSCWDTYKHTNYLDKSLNNDELFHHYIKHKIYLNKSIQSPVIKYKQEYIINSFYNMLYGVIEDNALLNYYHFLNNEDKDKIYPDIFHFYIYEFIDWELFKQNNKLKCSLIDCYKLFIEKLNDFNHFKIDFKNNHDIYISQKKELLELQEFKDFYSNVICYIHKNTSLIDLNKYYSLIFNHNIIHFPKNFNLKNYEKVTKNDLRYNFMISYINEYQSLLNLLLTIIYQNYDNFKIIILNKNDDKKLKDNIDDFKKTFDFENIDIIEYKEYQNIHLEKYIDVFDINLLIDTNFYFSTNNTLEQLIDTTDNNILNQVIVEKKKINNQNYNSLMIINSYLLLNNQHFIHNYLYIEKDVTYLNGLIHTNDTEYLSHDFYNYDTSTNIDYVNDYPIFVFYTNEEQKKIVHSESYYHYIKIEHSTSIHDFFNKINNKALYKYFIVIYLDKFEDNLNTINFNIDEDLIKNNKITNIMNDKKNKKAKNITKKSKLIPKFDDYKAFICDIECVKKYIEKCK